jgi:hypothetical protein
MTRTAAKPNRGGTRIVAFFDADIPSFTLRGCAVALEPDGTWAAWTPRLPDDDGAARRAVYFRDTQLQRSLTDVPLALYRQLGGTADLEPQARAA